MSKLTSHNRMDPTQKNLDMLLEVDGHALVFHQYGEPRASVAHVRRAPGHHVYVGRGRGGEKTRWGNPFPLPHPETELARVECLLAHALHVRREKLWRDVHELKGSVLSCWCHPKRCHADTLARMANAPCPLVELKAIIAELREELVTLLDAQMETPVPPTTYALLVESSPDRKLRARNGV